MSEYIPYPQGDAWQTWARRLSQYLGTIRSLLAHKTGTESATQDGLMLWDSANGYPVISDANVFRQIVVEGGHGHFIRATSQTAASADTAYSITYDAPTGNYNVDRDSSNPERIVVTENGDYLVSFTAELKNASASDVTFYLWPAINGANEANSRITTVLHSNGSTVVVSRTYLLTMTANQYLEMKFAVSSTNGTLNANTATSFAPASPASTLSVTRLHA